MTKLYRNFCFLNWLLFWHYHFLCLRMIALTLSAAVIASSLLLVWTILMSTIQFCMKRSSRFHQKLGYLAIAVNFVMCWTAVELSFMQVREGIVSNSTMLDIFSALLYNIVLTHASGATVSVMYDAVVWCCHGNQKRKEYWASQETHVIFEVICYCRL